MSENAETKRKVDKDDNAFPLCVYPPKMQQIIKELANDRLYPIDYVGSAILFVASVLIGAGSYLWTILGRTFANIYVAIIGDQGTNKSTPIEWALSPLLEIDHSENEAYNAKVEEWRKKDNKYRYSAQEEDNPGPFPQNNRLLCNDTTPEVLLRMHSSCPMGIGQYQDELTRIFGCLNRYHAGANEDLLLQLFSGKPITIDRATYDKVMSVLHPYFCLIGTIQPKRFLQIMAKNSRFDSGLFARFLPVTHLLNPALNWNLAEDLPSDVDHRYRKLVNALYERRQQTSHETPVEYKLCDDAIDAIQTWQNDHEDRIEKYGRDTDRAVFRKIQIYVLKFALIVQILWDVSEEYDNPNHLISFNSAIYATILADYFYANAKELGRSLDKSVLSSTEQNIYDALPDMFTTVEGREIAKRFGLGKTCFHDFINKVKGILIEQPARGTYQKKFPMANK